MIYIREKFVILNEFLNYNYKYHLLEIFSSFLIHFSINFSQLIIIINN